MSRRVLQACLLAAALSGSATFAQSESYEADPGLIQMRGLIVFFHAGGPLSYVTLTPKDLPPGAVLTGPVKGRGCQQGVSTPIVGLSTVPRMSVAGGEGGFEMALQDIRDRHPDLKGIYDVKIDDHVVNILTIYQRQCTEVTAKGFK